ncbi:MAG: nitrate reductase cytochrome c-type subunit, partial [Candidatus Krumholzibacteria bacterium]|nr:nitrate reductase cytochrome c-type subunit [Candidatus Krumholzibacteria bacterium]
MKVLRGVLLGALIGVVVGMACGPKSGNVADGVGLATGQPGMNTYTAGEPGETTVLARLYDKAPPLVPHAVNSFEISRTTNDCLDCHLEGDELDDGHVATAVPTSHYLNAFTGVRSKDSVTPT